MNSTLEQKPLHTLDDPQLTIPNPTSAYPDDYESKLAEAQSQLEILRSQTEAIEREKRASEQLNLAKQDFIGNQVELAEKLSTAVTAIERELAESRQEIDDLEQTKLAFAGHLKRVESLNPETWPKETLADDIRNALALLERADTEYEMAVSYFNDSRRSGLFNGSSILGRIGRGSSEFRTNLINGLAFNLSILVLGTIALIIFLNK